MADLIGAPLDLVIDDGLHSPEANANTLAAFLPLLSPHGILVIEDILPEYDEIWVTAEYLLKDQYEMRFFPGSILRESRPEGMAVFWRAR